MPRLTVVVPATDSPPTLAASVAAIRSALEPPEELLVVDEPAGAGPAAARNDGVRRARGDIVVFVDADVLVHRDAFVRIRAAFDADPGLDALFGSYDANPGAAGIVSAFRNLLHHHVHHHAAGSAATFWSGLGAVRRGVLVAAGGFDADRYPVASIEDIELGMRLAGRGARIELDPRLRGTHLKRWTLVEMMRTDLVRRGMPWVALLLRNRAAPPVLNLGWRHRLSAGACLAGVAACIWRRPELAVSAIVAFVALNYSFYALLLRRRGPVEAAFGVALHALHHLVGVAAVPAGICAHVFDRDVSRR